MAVTSTLRGSHAKPLPVAIRMYIVRFPRGGDSDSSRMRGAFRGRGRKKKGISFKLFS